MFVFRLQADAFQQFIFVGLILIYITDSINAACESNWLEFEGNCYYVSNADGISPREDRTWRQSRDWCLTSGGDLATILSANERRWLTNITEERQFNGALWIGLNSLADGNTFRYVWRYNDGDGWRRSIGRPSQRSAIETECFWSFNVTLGNQGERRLFPMSYIHSSGHCCASRSWIDGNPDGYRDWREGEPRTDISAMCVAQLTRAPSPGVSDEVGTETCESRCADRPDCMAYTFISNSHPLATWKGECLGANESRSQTPDDYGFSGKRISCDDEQGLWHVANCGQQQGFICKKVPGSPTPTTPPPTLPTPGYCPVGYFEAVPDGGNKCFKVVHTTAVADDDVTWNEAVQLCRAGPGLSPNIASVQSSIETAVLAMRITDYAWGYWIGLRAADSDPNVWLWADNSDVSYNNWAAGKPSSTIARCAELWTFPGPVGTWNNQDCISRRGFVCQTHKDPGSPITTPLPTESNWCTQPNYKPYGRACYRMLTSTMSWTAAQATCKADNADLATVNSESENAALVVLGYRQLEPVWLGMKKDAGGEWKWSDGWPVVYTNWAQQNGQDPAELCSAMDVSGRWKSENCASEFRAFCKISIDPIPTNPPPPEDNSEWKCPAGTGWEEFAGDCYYVSTSSETTGNWATAAATCQMKAGLAHEATLASIHHDAVNTYLYNRLLKNNRQQAWIGLKKQALGWPFEWLDGSPVQYTKWAPSEPNDKDGSQLCVEMYASFWPGLWNDHLCNENLYSRGFICKAQKALMPTTPTSPPGLACPPGCINWRTYGAYCYYIEKTARVSVDEAQKDCVKRAGRYGSLVTIGNRETELHLTEALQEELGSSASRVGFWIGFVRKNENSPFQWIDRTPVNRTFWEPGEPNNQNNENCVEMFSNTGLWNDRDCSHSLNYVCQVNKVDLGLTVMPPTRPDALEGRSGISLSTGGMAGVVIGTALIVLVSVAIVVGAVVVLKGSVKLSWR